MTVSKQRWGEKENQIAERGAKVEREEVDLLKEAENVFSYSV